MVPALPLCSLLARFKQPLPQGRDFSLKPMQICQREAGCLKDTAGDIPSFLYRYYLFAPPSGTGWQTDDLRSGLLCAYKALLSVVGHRRQYPSASSRFEIKPHLFRAFKHF